MTTIGEPITFKQPSTSHIKPVLGALQVKFVSYIIILKKYIEVKVDPDSDSRLGIYCLQQRGTVNVENI